MVSQCFPWIFPETRSSSCQVHGVSLCPLGTVHQCALVNDMSRGLGGRTAGSGRFCHWPRPRPCCVDGQRKFWWLPLHLGRSSEQLGKPSEKNLAFPMNQQNFMVWTTRFHIFFLEMAINHPIVLPLVDKPSFRVNTLMWIP